MHTWALVAIFASAVLHAAWNALLKGTADQAAASVIIVTIAGSISGLLAILVGPAQVPFAGWPAILAAGLIEGVYFVSLAQALRRLPLGTAYGLSRGAGLLLIWPFGIVLFHEALDMHTAVGALLLSLGLLVLVERRNDARGIVAAAICAVSVAAYPLAYKQALVAGVSPFPLFSLSLSLSLPIQLVLLRRGLRERIAVVARTAPWRVAIGGILCAASFLLFLVALRVAGPGRITALRNTSVLFAMLLGGLAHESWSGRQLLSGAAISAGAVMLSW